MSANNEQILNVEDLNARPKELDAAAAAEITGGLAPAGKPPSPYQNPMGPPPAAAGPTPPPAAANPVKKVNPNDPLGKKSL